MQIDLKGWGLGYISSFQQHCLLQMLNNVAGNVLSLITKAAVIPYSLVSLLVFCFFGALFQSPAPRVFSFVCVVSFPLLFVCLIGGVWFGNQ